MKKLKISLSILLLLCVIYSAAWGVMAYKINQGVARFYYSDTQNNGLMLWGSQPQLSGFPLQPVLTYKRGFGKGNISFLFDEMKLSGFPIPGFPLKVIVDNPIQAYNEKTDTTITLTYFSATAIVPKSIPRTSVGYHLEQWQKDVGKIEIKDVLIKGQQAKIFANGHLGLDENLQADILMHSKTYNYNSIVETLVRTGTIKPFLGTLTLSGMNSMAKTDPSNGKNYIDLDLLIKDRDVFFGPIKVTTLSPLEWR